MGTNTKQFPSFIDRSPPTEANMPPGTKALGYTRSQIDSIVLNSVSPEPWVERMIATRMAEDLGVEVRDLA